MAILTVSRELGSGGSQIGRDVAASLDYIYLDKERILQEISAKGERWKTWSEDLDERCPTVWEKYDWSFRGFGALIQSTIVQFALRDNVVVMGRGGNFLLQAVPHSLSVRIVSNKKRRIERIMRRDSVDTETAKILVEKSDHERECFIRALYGKHWGDPEAYERVFNTDLQARDEITALLIELLRERTEMNTESATTSLAMLAKAAHIKAGLLTDPKIFVPTLDAFAQGSRVVVYGIIHNPKERKRVEDTARQMAADTPLDFQLHYRS